MEEITVDYQNVTQEIREDLINLRNNINKVSEGFVVIGYRLKNMIETEVYKVGGYKNITEYAKAELQLSGSDVSRFIKINDKFSENGYSLNLQEKYKPYGYTKLSEMLTLSQDELELVNEDMTRAQIREIKKVLHQENEVEEEFCAGAKSIENTKVERDLTPREQILFAVVKAYFIKEGRPQYKKFWEKEFKDVEKEALFIVAPSKFKVTKALGYNIVFNPQEITVKPMVGQKESFTYQEFVDAFKEIFSGETAADAFAVEYGEEYEKKSIEEIKEAQGIVAEVKKEVKLEQGEVAKEESTQNTIVKQTVVETVTETVSVEEEIPGQMYIDDEEYREYQPERKVQTVDADTGEITEEIVKYFGFTRDSVEADFESMIDYIKEQLEREDKCIEVKIRA